MVCTRYFWQGNHHIYSHLRCKYTVLANPTNSVACHMGRDGQNRIFTPYMTVYMVISLPNIPYTHRIYMVLANPTYEYRCSSAPASYATAKHNHRIALRELACMLMRVYARANGRELRAGQCAAMALPVWYEESVHVCVSFRCVSMLQHVRLCLHVCFLRELACGRGLMP